MQGQTLNILNHEVSFACQTTGNGFTVTLSPNTGVPRDFLENLVTTAQRWCHETLSENPGCIATATLRGEQVVITASGNTSCRTQLEQRAEMLPTIFQQIGRENHETKMAYAGSST